MRSSTLELVALERLDAALDAGQLVGEPFVLGAGLLCSRLAGRAGKRGSVPPALSTDDPEGIERRAKQRVALWLKGASS
ncbi:MAG: hypothetical protein AAGF11_27610 [Myxococcota bacterium]